MKMLVFLKLRCTMTSMYKIHLSPEEKQALENSHRHSESDRIKAILLRSEGWDLPRIAQALRRHETTITRFISDYCNYNKLQSERGGSESHLNEEQTKEIISHLEQNTYLKVCDIREFILQKYDIKYSIRGLTNWLHSYNFVYKKPVGVPRKIDPEAQKEFIKYYKNLKDNLNEDEVIIFMDSVHPTQNTKITYGWIKKGTDKPLSTTASRTKLNIVGAIDLLNIGSPIFNKFDTINKDNIISFLKDIHAKYLDKTIIHLILDGAGYHKAKDVQNKASDLGIKLHFLPPYSPNLNPIERLWKIMNEKARNNKYFANKSCFIKAIDDFLHDTIPKITQELSTRITDNFQIISDTKQAY